MPTRIITRPDDITLKPPVKDAKVESISFDDFVRQLLNQPVWASSYKLVRMASAIEEALDGGGNLRLAEEDWKELKGVVEEPPAPQGGQGTYGYTPWVMRQLLPYLDAIMEAVVEKTEKPADDDEG